MTKQIPWNTGDGNITLTYNGQGNDSVIVDSDINDDEDSREQVLTISGGGIARQVTVRQEACPVNFRTSEGDIIKTADGDYFNVAEPLPYDAEIEYLESSGTQWINTNWIPDLTKNLRIECSAGWVVTERGMLISAYNNSKDLSIELYYYGYNWLLRVYAGMANVVLSQPIKELNVLYPIEITYTASDRLCTINIDDKTHSGYVPAEGCVLNTQTAVLGSDQMHRYPYGMFGEMKVYNPNLVIDFIPVRIGTTGYMYDKVSGQLFGNAGTGNFILGPDKTS